MATFTMRCPAHSVENKKIKIEMVMETNAPEVKSTKDSWKRSLVKSIFYRIIIIILDFTTVYIFTGKVVIAIGFMLVSNVYTTVVYFFYERVWGKIKWGKKAAVN